MADPVLGSDALVYFQKGGDEYFPYACATDITVSFEMETKSVKTIGDGNWDKPRGQKKSYQIDLSGLVKFDDDAVPHAFDIYSSFDGMTSIAYRVIFTNDQGQLKLIEGNALPVNWSIGGGSEGFATSSAALKGDGAPDIRDLIIPCPSYVETVQLVQDGDNALIRITSHVGGVARYDYSVDGGGYVSQFATSYIQDLPLEGGLGVGEHTITIIPICQNGYSGDEFTTTFEIMGSGGSCDAPTGLNFTSIDETSAVANWTAPGSPPADGYAWELYVGASFVTNGTAASTSQNLTGLTGGLTYTFKVKSICETGVSESGFVFDTFTTTGSSDPTQAQWSFTETGIVTGNFVLKVNAVAEVIRTTTDSDVLIIAGGDVINVTITAFETNIRDLFVKDLTSGIVLYFDASIDNQEYEFTATENHIYQIIANVYE